MKPLVIFHANCPDGWCAAWSANSIYGDKADYLPANYGEPPLDVAGRGVFILDFSYKRPVLLEMAKTAEFIRVIDHHKTAQADLEGGYEVEGGFRLIGHGLAVKFDMNKSGGRLAWEYFRPSMGAPWLVDYTEDRDLFRHALPMSKEINAALASYPRTFEQWDRFFFNIDGGLMKVARPGKELLAFAKEGTAILRYQQQQVDSLAAFAREIDMDGHKILSVNTSVLFSEVAGKLAEGRPFGAVWFQRQDGKRQWSLRSRDGGVDVSEIAKRHGGGGHRNAAGFEE